MFNVQTFLFDLSWAQAERLARRAPSEDPVFRAILLARSKALRTFTLDTAPALALLASHPRN